MHLPGQYFALYLEMKDGFGIAQRGPVCRARHTPGLGCGGVNSSGRSWWSPASFGSLLQWHWGPVPYEERKPQQGVSVCSPPQRHQNTNDHWQF